jgi:hypothetical protein
MENKGKMCGWISTDLENGDIKFHLENTSCLQSSRKKKRKEKEKEKRHGES